MTRRTTRVVAVVAILLIVGVAVHLGTITSRACLGRASPVLDVDETASARFFSDDYQTARSRFLSAAADSGGETIDIPCPQKGPDDQQLFTDLLLIGPEDARTVVVVSSGTHGVEGFTGSGIQTGLLQSGIADRVPPDTRLIMIHGINPYGMAHLRRFNEDNVDLNRNFLQHRGAPPPNEEYPGLATALAPTSLSFSREVIAWSRIYTYGFPHVREALRQAVSSGQYSHPDGLFFGGTTAVWSNTMLESFTRRHLSTAERVIVIDIHTGLGKYGAAEIILNDKASDPSVVRAVEIWGEDSVRWTDDGDSSSVHLDASLKRAFPRWLPEVEVTAVSLEFGTLPLKDILIALRAENWLHHHGGSDHPRASSIKTCLLRAFYPASEEWRANAWQIGERTVTQALDWVGNN